MQMRAEFFYDFFLTPMSPICLGGCMVKISCTRAQNEIDQDFTYRGIEAVREATAPPLCLLRGCRKRSNLGDRECSSTSHSK